MKRKSPIHLKNILLALAFAFQANIATAADERALLLLEAGENIEYVSQQITKAYFYKQQGIRVSHAKRDLKEGMAALNSDIKRLAAGAVDDEERNVLLFISFTRDELKDTLGLPYSEENGALMLDFSESLLEGAELIAGKHKHKNDAKEAMLVIVERMLFLLERINKYYIAFRAGFNDHNNVVQLQESVKEFEADLAVINKFKRYPTSLQARVKKLNKFWPIAKRFYLGIEKGALPVIVMASTDGLEKHLKKLERYHHNAIVGSKSKR